MAQPIARGLDRENPSVSRPKHQKTSSNGINEYQEFNYNYFTRNRDSRSHYRPAHGDAVKSPPHGRPARPGAFRKLPPPCLDYASVVKWLEKGRVAKLGTRMIFGTMAAVLRALGMSRVSRAINTAFGVGPPLNARDTRKMYRFSKDSRYHEAVTYLILYRFNYCWSVRNYILLVLDRRASCRRRTYWLASSSIL